MSNINRSINKLMSHKNTPLVLTVVSCTGVVVTAIMSGRASIKAHHVMVELKEKYTDPDSTVRKIPPGIILKKTWKLYAPAVGAGVITIGTIITMNRVSERNLAIVSTGATLAVNTLKDYQQHVLEEIGSEKESKIRHKIAKDRLRSADIDHDQALMVLASGEDNLCYDMSSGRFFKGNMEEIRGYENDLNRRILLNNYVSLNEVYDVLGLERNDLGDDLGFNLDNLVDIHFSAQLVNKKPVLAISFINVPVHHYTKLLEGGL